MNRSRPAPNGMKAISSNLKLLENQVLNINRDFLSGFEFGLGQKKDFSKKQIIACGMGGSILAAELLSENFSAVVKDYSLPKIKDRKNTVVFCFSYSGNTEETLACAKEAKKLGLKTFGFSRGGKLKKIVDEFFEIPDFKLPRFAVPYWLGLVRGLLSPRRGSGSTLSPLNGLTKKLDKIKLNIKQVVGQAEALAKKLQGKKVIIYSPGRLEPLAHFWEVNLDETSKVPSFVSTLPDADHHDIASFSQPRLTRSKNSPGKDFAAIFLDDNSFLKKRTELTAGIFKRRLKIDAVILRNNQTNRLSKILNHLLLAYLTSLVLARYYRVNPFEKFLQEKLKKDLNKK